MSSKSSDIDHLAGYFDTSSFCLLVFAQFLALAGWRTIAHNDVVRYPEVTIDDTLLDDLDDVLFSTEPYTFAEADLAAFAEAHPAHAAKARLINAEMVSWYGSRAIAGLSYLKDFAAEVRGR